MQDNSTDYRLVVFGAGAVGKSSIVLRFLRNTYKEKYQATIEDTYTHIVNSGKNVCTLLITDTTGTHSFPAMRKLAITRGNAFLLVYSVTLRQSLRDLNSIYEQIRLEKGDLRKVPIYLVGNKCESPDRQVALSEGEKQARAWECGFLETSAKTGHNVTQLFRRLLALETSRALTLSNFADVDGCDVTSGGGYKKGKQHGRK